MAALRHEQPGTGVEEPCQLAERGALRDVEVAQTDEVGTAKHRPIARRDALHVSARDHPPQHPLPRDADHGVGRDHLDPRVRDLIGDRDERPGPARHPGGWQVEGSHRHAGRHRHLAPALGRLDVVEDRALGQVDGQDVDAGSAQPLELVRGRGLAVDADDRRGAEA